EVRQAAVENKSARKGAYAKSGAEHCAAHGYRRSAPPRIEGEADARGDRRRHRRAREYVAERSRSRGARLVRSARRAGRSPARIGGRRQSQEERGQRANSEHG